MEVPDFLMDGDRIDFHAQFSHPVEQEKSEDELDDEYIDVTVESIKTVSTQYREIIEVIIKLPYTLGNDDIEPGAYISVQPENDSELIKEFFELIEHKPSD